MCGITAVLTLAGRSKSSQPANKNHKENQNPSAPAIGGHSHVQHDKQPNLRQQVDESLKYITHRGPDHSGSWASEDGLIGMLSEVIILHLRSRKLIVGSHGQCPSRD